MATPMLKKNRRSILPILFTMILLVQAWPAFSVSASRMALLVNKAKHRSEVIVLIHGLMRTSFSMRPLKIFLEKQGYQVYFYSYPSARYSIHEHGDNLNQFLRKLLQDHPGVKISFVTHSLGGIITREALAQWSPSELKNIKYLIMLAPPNQGSNLAKISTKMFPLLNSTVKPLTELSSDQNSYVHHVPIPNIKIGIIAGRYDAKVPPEAARLEGQAEPVIINTTHTFIMYGSKTKQLVKNFLEKGRFDE